MVYQVLLSSIIRQDHEELKQALLCLEYWLCHLTESCSKIHHTCSFPNFVLKFHAPPSLQALSVTQETDFSHQSKTLHLPSWTLNVTLGLLYWSPLTIQLAQRHSSSNPCSRTQHLLSNFSPHHYDSLSLHASSTTDLGNWYLHLQMLSLSLLLHLNTLIFTPLKMVLVAFSSGVWLILS